MEGRRWLEMQAAREVVVTWVEVGEALAISHQSAHEWYQRKIDFQERCAADLHDAARAARSWPMMRCL